MNKLILLFALVAIGVCAPAQKIGGADNTKPVVMKKAAILPLMFWEDDKGSKEYVNSAKEPYEQNLFGIFEKLGIARADQATVNAAWTNMKGAPFSTADFTMPDAETLVTLGKKLGVDYVVVSRCLWKVRSPWVGLGPKTKAHATVDLWIIDVAKSEFALKASQIKADSTEKASTVDWAVDLLVAPVSMFSGGPKTDHEKKSGVLALTKALDPWIQKVTNGNTKIGGGI